MYRQGLSTSRIAEICNVDTRAVNWTIGRRAREDPTLKSEHLRNAPPPRHSSALTPQWLARLQEFTQFVEENGFPPRSSPMDLAERNLARWVRAQRRAAGQGVLSAERAEALDAVGSWRTSMRGIRDSDNWTRNLSSLADYLARHDRLPSYKNRDDDVERRLGTWLHSQRQKAINGQLSEHRRRELDKAADGWNTWRPRRGTSHEPPAAIPSSWTVPPGARDGRALRGYPSVFCGGRS
ncbi:hypothetical protein AHiyo1_49420 [Arthrobacter sp. Hiyo1]|uniref:helicase associated domain-containing protein n=1 Tax=Arthrobacter sp. Hiyo1 TaxID=1588020 RepID=UPI0006A357F0|nr:hypothetical protein AHiyo1_49420 [Arthrobacter sp. Hiyo1]